MEILYKEISYKIIGICMDVHNNLGAGFSEIVYKDAIEYELKDRGIHYEREKEYSVNYKKIILPHRFYADFIILNTIILEVKGTKEIAPEHVSQAINYLKVSKNELALVVNFGETRLNYKRVIL